MPPIVADMSFMVKQRKCDLCYCIFIAFFGYLYKSLDTQDIVYPSAKEAAQDCLEHIFVYWSLTVSTVYICFTIACIR